MRQKLRIGLLMNSYELPLWEYRLIERLIDSHYASIELVVVNGAKNPRPPLLTRLKNNWTRLLSILYTKLDQKLFPAQPNAFEPKDTRDLLAGVPEVIVTPKPAKLADRFHDDDIEKIKTFGLDVLVRFGFRILRGDILTSARHGVWSYHHGDNKVNRGGPAGFWEVMEHWDVTGSILQILTEELDAGRVLYRSYSQTHKRSVHRNRNNFYWKSMSFLPRKLEELYDVGEEEFFRRVDEENAYPSFYSNPLFSSRNLTNWRMLRLIVVHLWMLARERFNSVVYLDQWILLFSIRKGLSTSFWRFEKIVPPKDRFYADPFVVHKDDKYYIFLEEFLYEPGKGHISVIELDNKGNHARPVTVIDRPYHLSYPFVLEHDGDYYMIPDSRADRTVQLFKCVDFPLEWEFQCNLMEGVEAVDSTLFHHRNKWWLFCNMIENPGASSLDELYLFYADDLRQSAWTPHRRNPVVSDVRRSRPGGGIFVHNGKIIRPSQNNDRRYGYGLKMNEIRTLNENEYEEVEFASIEPKWDTRLRATHTFNHAGRATVIDAVMRRSRLI